MAEFPALPLWTDAYLGDTTHLTTLEHGAYLLLLMTAWRTRDCELPDDDRLLARYARLTSQQWKRTRPVLAEFFAVENGVWKQGRLTDERDAVKRHRELQSEKGKAGAKAKALKTNGRHKAPAKSGLSSEEAQGKPDSSSLLHTHTHTSVDKSTDGEAVEPAPDFDPIKALFDDGIRVLGAAGTPERAARSMIGRWRRDYGDDQVALAIAAAETQNISQPLEWIPKRLALVGKSDHRANDRSSKDFDLVENINANPERWRGSG